MPCDLLGDRLAAVLEADEDVDQHDDEHDHADDAGDQEHPPLQVLDLLGVLAGRLPRVLRGVLGACQADGSEQRCPPRTPTHRRFGPAHRHHHGQHGVASTPGTVNSYPLSTAKLGWAKCSVRNCEPPSSTRAVQNSARVRAAGRRRLLRCMSITAGRCSSDSLRNMTLLAVDRGKVSVGGPAVVAGHGRTSAVHRS